MAGGPVLNLNTADYVAIGCYFLILIVIGFFLSRKASRSLEDYFLGGRKLPWWALGMSGTASWFDITGTMVIVSFLYMLGPRGIYIEFRGGACLVLAFMMVFAGKWHRRSGCITGAEWMEYRFGSGAGGQFSRVLGALGIIATIVGMLAYLVKGVGGFLAIFLPFSPTECALIMVVVATLYTMASGFYGVVVTDVIQTAIICIAVVVVTTMAVMHVADVPDLDAFAQKVTARDFSPALGAAREAWSTSVPSWKLPMQRGYEPYGDLVMFALFYLLKNVLQGLSSGADPRYFGARNERECGLLSAMWGGLIFIRWPMMIGFALLGLFLVDRYFGEKDVDALQKAARMIKADLVLEAYPDARLDLETSDQVQEILPKIRWKEVAEGGTVEPAVSEELRNIFGLEWRERLTRLVRQEELIASVVPKPRWGDILSLASRRPGLAERLRELLGEDEFETRLKLISYEGTINPERILPAVLLHRIPIGLRGLLLVALLAASMSTFDSAVNLAAGFFTRDLYQRYFRPLAGNRELIVATYAFGVVLVASGFVMALGSDNINDIWGWIIMCLTAGMAIPGILRLYWWRFNAAGVVTSSMVGLILPFVIRFAYKGMHEWSQFGIVTGVTLLAALVGTYLYPPTERKVLEHFYKTTRPFGLWRPLKASLNPTTRQKMEREHRNDIIAVPFVMVTQVTLYMLPMQLVIRAWKDFGVTLVIFLVGVWGVYRFWYCNLPHVREGVASEAEIDAGQI
jgi:Na+/proline symporter